MGVRPTHSRVGVWATVLLVAVRLLQGFSTGGEVGGSATFISESTPAAPLGDLRGLHPLGATGGFALAAAVAGITTGLTTDAQMDSWGWQIPFLLALPLTPFCPWARTRVEETHGAEEAHEQHSPVGYVFRKQPKALLQASAISAATNGTAYIGLTYLSIHLIQRLG